MFNVYLFLYVFTIVATVVIGFIVYKNNPKSWVNRSYALITISILFWVVSVFLADVLRIYEYSFFFTKLAIIGPSWIPLFYLLFVNFFLDPTKKFPKYLYILSVPSILLTLFSFTNYNVKSISLETWGTDFKPGILYYFLLTLFIIYIGYATFVLIRHFFKTKGLKKFQIVYVLFGGVVAIIFGIFLNLVFPFLGFGMSSVYGPLSALIFLSSTAYAIIRYRLMDIRVIIRRSAVFAVLVAIITSIYALIAYVLSTIFQDLIGTSSVLLNGIVTAVLVAIGFEPLKKWLSNVTDKFLFKAEYDPQQLLSELGLEVISITDFKSILKTVSNKLLEAFKLDGLSIYLLDKEQNNFYLAFNKGGKHKPLKELGANELLKFYQFFKNKGEQIIIRDEVARAVEVFSEKSLKEVFLNMLKLMDRYNVGSVVILTIKGQPIGFIALGEKKSGDAYSTQDLHVLEIVANQLSVVIENARLYDEQRKFAQVLQKTVDEKTKELQVANKELLRLDKAKSEFISIASHQLRTPLTVIRGYLSMLGEGDFGQVPKSIEPPLDRVSKSANRLILLIEDLLNISRLESGRMEFKFEKTDFVEMVRDVVDELKLHAKNKGLKLEYIETEKDLPKLKIDRLKMREVIMNFIDNAIKYTDKGFVKVYLDRPDHKVMFCVEDSGRGMDKDDLSRLFKKFSRAKGASLKHTEGTGLGLFITKKIVEVHGGRVWAESPGPGKGSKFCFELDFKKLDKLKDIKGAGKPMALKKDLIGEMKNNK